MFKNMKIGVRLGLGFSLVLLLLVLIAVIGITRLGDLDDSLDKMTTDRYPKTVWAKNLLEALDVVARVNRNTLLIDDDAKLDKERAVRDEARKSISENLKKLEDTVRSEPGLKLMASLKESRVAYIKVLDKFVEANQSGDRKGATKILFGEMVDETAAYRKSIQTLIEFQEDAMEKASKDASQAYETARNLMITLAVIAALMSIGIAFWVTRSITRPVNEAVAVANSLAAGDLTVKIEVNSKDETGMLLMAMQAMVEKLAQIVGEVRSAAEGLSSASEEVSATSQSLSQATNEQAASVEETSASVEQMGASINQNSENAKVTDGMATQASKQATQGGAAVKETVHAMKSIAGKIGIIDDIAYQTNLLALNAAIEAARAGEHGKGFAVVAAEVRKLAERSQVAAQEIGELASGSVSKAEDAGKLLDEIVPAINKTSDLVQEITAASEEQSSGAAQINTAMSQLNQITQQNASATEELAATAEEMSSQAEQLQQLMTFFKVQGGTPVAKHSIAHTNVAHASAAKPVKAKAAPKFTSASHDEAEFVKF
jgi:methyl-accepting chemotaxis protein